MADFVENFGLQTTGQFPTGWTEVVDKATWDVEVDGGSPGGKRLRGRTFVADDSGDWNLARLDWTAIGDMENSDTYLNFFNPHVAKVGISIRGSQYFAGFHNDLVHDELELRFNNTTKLVGASLSRPDWIRVLVDGNDFKIKGWNGTQGNEPASWNIEHTHVGGVPVSGPLGIEVGRTTSNSTVETYIHEIQVSRLVDTPPVDIDDLEQATNLKRIWRTQTSTWGNLLQVLPPGFPLRDANLFDEVKGKIYGINLTKPPGAGLVVDTIPKAAEQEVEGRVMFDSIEGGFSWSAFWKIEWAKAGLIACGDGIYEDDPSLVSGVFAWMETSQPWPYSPCDDKGKNAGLFGVSVVAKGNTVFETSITVPEFGVAVRNCPINWIGMKLQVLRDPGDATRNTMFIKAAFDLSGAIPDTVLNGWDLDFSATADVPCGHGGYALKFIQTAWGGDDPGFAYFDSGLVTNLGEVCVADMTTPIINQPTITVEIDCQKLFARGGPYTGPGLHIESRWVIREIGGTSLAVTELAAYGTSKAADPPELGTIVVDTGFQTDQLTEYTLDTSTLDPNTDYTIEVEYRDDLGNTTPASVAAPFHTTTIPESPTLKIVSVVGNLITVVGSDFVSLDPTSVLTNTSWELDTDPSFGEDAIPQEGPLFRYDTAIPSELMQYTYDITGLGIDSGDVIYFRVSYGDQYGCSAVGEICLQYWPDCPPDLIESYTKPVAPTDSWTKQTPPIDTSSGCKDCP